MQTKFLENNSITKHYYSHSFSNTILFKYLKPSLNSLNILYRILTRRNNLFEIFFHSKILI